MSADVDAPDAPDAYDRRSAEYAALFGTIESTAVADRDLVARWAARRTGRLLDAGCGPGQWTAWLAARGHDVEGIDAAPSFVAHARATWPGVPFRRARLDDLGVEAGSLDGVLAWYSLIHSPGPRLDAVLAELARAVGTGGELVLGLFDGEPGEPFAHQVVTAYTWSEAAMAERLDRAGFDTVEVERRHDAGARPHLALVARRRRAVSA
jgi:SAM-dependent methyltransferase